MCYCQNSGPHSGQISNKNNQKVTANEMKWIFRKHSFDYILRKLHHISAYRQLISSANLISFYLFDSIQKRWLDKLVGSEAKLLLKSYATWKCLEMTMSASNLLYITDSWSFKPRCGSTHMNLIRWIELTHIHTHAASTKQHQLYHCIVHTPYKACLFYWILYVTKFWYLYMYNVQCTCSML